MTLRARKAKKNVKTEKGRQWPGRSAMTWDKRLTNNETSSHTLSTVDSIDKRALGAKKGGIAISFLRGRFEQLQLSSTPLSSLSSNSSSHSDSVFKYAGFALLVLMGD